MLISGTPYFGAKYIIWGPICSPKALHMLRHLELLGPPSDLNLAPFDQFSPLPVLRLRIGCLIIFPASPLRTRSVNLTFCRSLSRRGALVRFPPTILRYGVDAL